MRIGVFLRQSGREGINYEAVANYARNLPEVELVREVNERPRPDPLALAEEIRGAGLDRIVLAADCPGRLKPAFTRAMALAGRDPTEVRLASFREHGGGGANLTERAQAIVACATRGVPFSLAAESRLMPVNRATLVIGGGVGGIQAALEIADAGQKVYLVERSGTIGGHMAMFDKTFPTLDCAACILTPKMVAVGQHECIELMTYSEVQQITGEPGAYRATILKKARRVDPKACVSCGVCAEVCPTRVPSEFDCGIAERKAVYMPFPQAVPNVYLIDETQCTYVQSGGKRCGACAKKCPKGCINLDQRDETIEVEVGNIVLAVGYDMLDASKIAAFGYGKLPNVLTSLEFERLTNASGPTGGRIVTKTRQFNKRRKVEEWVLSADGEPPRSVAIIHCVGSRDARYNSYCSRVCCMYSLKFAHLVKEKLEGAPCYEFYIDMRAFGKGYEEFAERIKAEGTFVVRGRTAAVIERDGQMYVKGEDMVHDSVVEFPVDMVILAVGLVPAAGTRRLAEMLRVPVDRDGWLQELDYNGDPTETERGGVFVAGACHAPKDIPDTVAQASAVAAGVLKSISRGKTLGSRADLDLSTIEARARTLRLA
ncbi:MAG TPA: CoB--CoM heterodisulfide reductase iron-sulfur subunit A family protein [Thermoanaerobaculaceae bacterium]|nr:CoB--CoM heterodisulfide reductase iron-sulfur subunit A family protein [Thermoanaerobaculaceae bacterium]HRS16010.1 CoB--CoM heterodisulfide reductase iron-sulfur subunit A family protein [Thermoanaerobaculaceae bacterium]